MNSMLKNEETRMKGKEWERFTKDLWMPQVFYFDERRLEIMDPIQQFINALMGLGYKYAPAKREWNISLHALRQAKELNQQPHVRSVGNWLRGARLSRANYEKFKEINEPALELAGFVAPHASPTQNLKGLIDDLEMVVIDEDADQLLQWGDDYVAGN